MERTQRHRDEGHVKTEAEGEGMWGQAAGTSEAGGGRKDSLLKLLEGVWPC